MKKLTNDSILLNEEMLLQLKYLKKLTKKSDDKLDNPCLKEEAIDIIYAAIERYRTIDQTNLDNSFQQKSLSGSDYLLDLQTISQKINKIINTGDFFVNLRKPERPELQLITNLLYTYEQTLHDMYLFFDLQASKSEYLRNMKYYKTPDEIKAYEEEFLKLASIKDLFGLEQLQAQIVSEIKAEWQHFTTPINTMTDEHFAFIGHSTTSKVFDTPFAHHLVSTSLFTQDLNDTFNCRYGFIFNPDNILLAGLGDLFVDNDAKSEEEVLPFSKTLKIVHPQKLIDDCQKLKKDNADYGIYDPIYNEVVIKGFNPIGLFCFTNGALEYDYAYRSALKLKESFPSLPLVALDIMKRKTADELLNMQLELLNSLNEQVLDSMDDILYTDIYRYQMFFEEFKNLKTKTYTKEDVARLFKKNYKLISYSLRPSALFSGKYTSEEVKYALLYGYRYDIQKILTGEITKETLLALIRNLSNCVGQLNQYFPYLDEFVMIGSHLQITDEIINALNGIKVHDFKSICLYLMPILKTELLKVKNQNELKMLKLTSTRANLLKEQEGLKKKEEKAYIYKQIQSKAWVLSGVTKEYGDTFLSLENIDKGINSLIEKAKVIDLELNALEQSPETPRIKERKADFRHTLENIKRDIAYLNEAKNHVERSLNDVRLYLFEAFGVDTLDEANALVKKANKFLRTYQKNSAKALEDINVKISYLAAQMTSLENTTASNNKILENLSKLEEQKQKR